MDFDVSIVSEKLGMMPSRKCRLSETRINPITQKQNCGYWEIRTEEFETFDSKDIQDALHKLLHQKYDTIKTILMRYQGTAMFRFFVEADPSNPPALLFQEDFICDINRINAALDIVLDIQYVYLDELEQYDLAELEEGQTIVIRKEQNEDLVRISPTAFSQRKLSICNEDN